MRRFFTAFVTLVALTFSLSTPSEAWRKGTASTAPPTDCTAGTGGGVSLVQRDQFAPDPAICWDDYYVPGAAGTQALSTADFYGQQGTYWWRPYDLSTMGAEGAAVMAREKARYVWTASPDHPVSSETISDSADFIMGFSNDPAIFPQRVRRLLYIGNTKTWVPRATGVGTVSSYIYHTPWMVYNPDATNKFLFYGESTSWTTTGGAPPLQHFTGAFSTPDLLGYSTVTIEEPPIQTTAFAGWYDFHRPVRESTGNWWSVGICTATTFCLEANGGLGFKKFTSTDGMTDWTETGSILLTSIGTTNMTPVASPYVDIGGQLYQLSREENRALAPNGNCDPTNPNIGMWLTLAPVDSNYNVLSSPAKIRLSDRHYGCYPGPTFFQDAGGYVEDGVLHAYALRGFPTNANQLGTYNNTSADQQHGRYTDVVPFNITASAGSSVLTVSAVTTGTILINSVVCLNGCAAGNNGVITAQLTGSTGGTGTYSISNAGTFSSRTMTIMSSGGLNQQFVDYYAYITNATAAAQAAPIGVRASGAHGVVTLTWHDILPNNTYRLYRGPTADGPWNLIGDITGGTTTDSPITVGRWFYKLVTMQTGVERGSRVVSDVCNWNVTVTVNKHVCRVISEGGDLSTVDFTYLTKIDAFLTAQNYHRYLSWWTDVRFGIKRGSGGEIAKIFDYGATKFPRNGDYTPHTTNTTYSKTAINGVSPGWVNGTSQSFGYWGEGRLNNIKNKNEITILAVIQKPNTNAASIVQAGENNGMLFRHVNGSPGSFTFGMSPATTQPSTLVTATGPALTGAATDARVFAGVMDNTNIKAYVNGVSGTPVDASTLANPLMDRLSWLRGQLGYSANGLKNVFFLGSGAPSAKNTGPAELGGSYSFSGNEAQFSSGGIVILDKGLSDSQVAEFTTFLQESLLIPAITYNIVTDFGAACTNGDDQAAFNAFNAAALAWQATNSGLIQLDLPSSGTCAFPGSTALRWSDGIRKLRVKGNNATMTNKGGASPGFFLGGRGLYQDNTHHAKTQTVAAGSSCVTLLTSGETSRFTVGQYAMMVGFDLQGVWSASYGYPSNNHFFDYVKIASSGSGQVCFETPLGNTYKSTWPLYAEGTAFEMHQGGPATLYALHANFDTEVTYTDVTIDQTSTNFATQAIGRSVTYISTTFTGPHGTWPTQNVDWRFINGTMPDALVEVDKYITYMTVSGSTIERFLFQSSSIDQIQMIDTTFTDEITGTPKRFIGYDLTLNEFRPGATAYGRSDWTLCVSCAIATFSNGARLVKGSNDIGVNVVYTMSGGVISFPNGTTVTGFADNGSGFVRLTVADSTGLVTGQQINASGVFVTGAQNTLYNITVIDGTHIDLPTRAFAGATWTGSGTVGNSAAGWAVPGTNLFWAGSSTAERRLHVTDVTQTATHTNIATTDVGGFPSIPLGTGSKLSLQTHPAPRFTCISCTGAEDVVAISSGAPVDTPLYSYNSRSYTGAIGTTTQSTFPMWGGGRDITLAVTNASALATQNFQISAASNYSFIKDSDGTTANYAAVVNSKVVATRVYTAPATVTGGQASDCSGAGTACLSFGEAFWYGQWNSGPRFSHTDAANCPGASCPAVTLTIRSNQGLILP